MCEVEKGFYERLVERQKETDRMTKEVCVKMQELHERQTELKEEAIFLDECVAYIEAYRKRKMFNVTFHSKRNDGLETFHAYQVYADTREQAFQYVKDKVSKGYVSPKYDPVTLTLNCGIIIYDEFLVREV